MLNDVFGASYQIELLYRQSRDAHRSCLFATAESLLAEAARLADEQTDLATQIRIKYWQAEARRMQSRYEKALTTYAWLIGVANDPPARASLADNRRAITYLAGAFQQFVECGRFLPAMPSAQLHHVIDMGLAFLSEVGRSQSAHGLRLKRGQLLKNEGRWEAARQEMEAALALRRRDPDSQGYTLGVHLCALGDLLWQMGEYDAAAPCYREVWEGSGRRFSVHNRRWAAKGLAYVEQSRGDLGAAEQWAREAVALAGQMESANAQVTALAILLQVLIERGKVIELVREGAAYWQWQRRQGGVQAEYFIGRRLADIRLAMARAALGLPPNPAEPLPDALPPPERREGPPASALPRAKRYLAAAQRWLARAQEPARRLDAQSGVETLRNELRESQERVKALWGLLGE